MLRTLATLVLAAAALPAAADDGPASVVAPFYAEPGSELDPANFGSFAGAALALLQENERLADDVTCIGFNFAMDTQDYDGAELAATFELAEDVVGNKGRVLATFDLFGEPREVDWSLERVGGAWKVVDVASAGWRLSEFTCEG